MRTTRRIVVALEGDIAELPLLQTAALGRDLLEVPVDMVCIGDRPGPARPLLAELGRASRFTERSPQQVAELLEEDRVRLVMLAQPTWRRHARRLWRRLRSSALLVHRRGDLPPGRVLCCADTPETAARLRSRVAQALVDPPDMTVLHADPPPPTWAESVCELYGFVYPAGRPDARPDWGSAHIVDWARPEPAVLGACDALRPDLVVLGWHHRRLPLPDPWLHPTAWRLSTRLASDVLLVPLGPAQ